MVRWRGIDPQLALAQVRLGVGTDTNGDVEEDGGVDNGRKADDDDEAVDNDDDDDDGMSISDDADTAAGFVAEAVRRRQLSHQQAMAGAAVSNAALPAKLRTMRAWHAARPDGAKAAVAAALAVAAEQDQVRSLARQAFDADLGSNGDSDTESLPADVVEMLEQLGVDVPGRTLDAVGVLMRGHPAPAAVEAALHGGSASAKSSGNKQGAKPDKLPSRRDVAKATETVKRLAGAADSNRAQLAARVAAAEGELEVLTARFNAAARAKADLEGRRRHHASRLAVHCRIRGVGDIEQSRLEQRLARRAGRAASRTGSASAGDDADADSALPSVPGGERPVDRLPAPSQVLGWDPSAWTAGNDSAAGRLSVLDLAAESAAKGATARLALLALRAADDGSEAAALARLCRSADLASVSVGRAGDPAVHPRATGSRTVCNAAQEVAAVMAEEQSESPSIVDIAAFLAGPLAPGVGSSAPAEGAVVDPDARAVTIDLSGGECLFKLKPVWRWRVVVRLTSDDLAAAVKQMAEQQHAREDKEAAANGGQRNPAVTKLVSEEVRRQALERASALRAASAAWEASFADGTVDRSEDDARAVLQFPAGNSEAAERRLTPRLPSIDAEARLWLQSHRLATLAARVDGAVALRFGAEAIAADIATGEDAAEDVSFAETVLEADDLASPFSPGTGPDELARVQMIKEEGAANDSSNRRPAKRRRRASSAAEPESVAQLAMQARQLADSEALAEALRSELRSLLESLPVDWEAFAKAGVEICQEPLILVRRDGTTHPNFPVTVFQLPGGLRISVPAWQPLVEVGIAVAIEAADPFPICAELAADSVEGEGAIRATMAAATAAKAVAIRRKLLEMGMPEVKPEMPPPPPPVARPQIEEETEAVSQGYSQQGGALSPASPAPVSLLARDGKSSRRAADSDPDTELAAALADVRSIVPQALRVSAAKDTTERAARAIKGAAPVPLLRACPTKGEFFPRDRPVSMPSRWAARDADRSVERLGAALARQSACAHSGLRVPELTACLRAATRSDAPAPSGDQPLEEVMDECGGPLWTASELLVFLDRFIQFPKDFSRIAAFLRRRRAPDCVGLYYAVKHRAQLKSALRRYRAHIRKRESLSSLRLAAECASRLRVPFPAAWLLGESADVTLSVSDAIPVRFAMAVGPYERLRRSLVAQAAPSEAHGSPLEQQEDDEAALVRFALAPPLQAGAHLPEHHAAWKSVYGSDQRQPEGNS